MIAMDAMMLAPSSTISSVMPQCGVVRMLVGSRKN
jgi:hypothetical protein